MSRARTWREVRAQAIGEGRITEEGIARARAAAADSEALRAERLADQFAARGAAEGLLPLITEDECRRLAKAYAAGYLQGARTGSAGPGWVCQFTVFHAAGSPCDCLSAPLRASERPEQA